MSKQQMLSAIGLMSGTSMDGVDAALLYTDGQQIELTDYFVHQPYSEKFRTKLRNAVMSKKVGDELVKELTKIHANIINKLLKESNLSYSNINIIGFHGHTIDHRPDQGLTWQIGDGKLLATLTKIDVVNDFRSADMAAGGQGAPLVPLYHKALLKNHDQPMAILNLGGVANITYVCGEEIIAFDVGPGNALMDDAMMANFNLSCDEGGMLASNGQADKGILEYLSADKFFKKQPPKSLDRDHFAYGLEECADLSPEDTLATLNAFTALGIANALKYLPKKPAKLYVSGGGVNNQILMENINQYCQMEALNITELGVNPDAVEAQAFAYLAVRSLKGLPLTLPTTTGVSTSSVTGGVFCPV